MKQLDTMTLEQVKQKCIDRAASQSDEVVSVKSLYMDPMYPSRLVIKRGEHAQSQDYPMLKRVYNQLSSTVYGCPGGYIEKLMSDPKVGNQELAARNFNHWVNVASEDKEILVRYKDDPKNGKTVRAMMPATWNPFPYERSVDQLITRFGPDRKVELATLNENQIVILLVTADLKSELLEPGTHKRIDDPIQYGFRWKDSDAGHGPMQLSPYTLRLICTNGAYTITRGVSVEIPHSGKTSGDIDAVLSNMSQGVAMISGYAEMVAEQIAASKQIRLDVDPKDGLPHGTFARITREHALTQLQQKYVEDAWNVEADSIPEPTVYRLANAYTRAGTHGQEMDEDKLFALQRVGAWCYEKSVMNNHRWN